MFLQDLRRIVYGSTVHSFSREWRKSTLAFQDIDGPYPYGLQTLRVGTYVWLFLFCVLVGFCLFVFVFCFFGGAEGGEDQGDGGSATVVVFLFFFGGGVIWGWSYGF